MELGLRLVLVGATDPVAPAVSPAAPDLIEGCRRGDRAALETVFRQHAAMLERLLVRLVGPRSDAEDLLQDTFAAAIVAFPRFRGHASIKTWLHRIAINVACNHLRSPRHRATALDPQTAAAPQRTPEDEVADAELLRRLYRYLDELGTKQRVALLLHVVDGLSMTEIAALMNATRAATKSRVFFARRALVRRLRADRVFGEEDAP